MAEKIKIWYYKAVNKKDLLMSLMKIKIPIILLKDKNFLLHLFFLTSLLVIYVLFPTATNNKFEQVIAALLFFIVVPILYYKIFFKKPLKNIGLQIGDYKEGLLWSGIGVLITLIVLIILLKTKIFLNNYIVPVSILNNFGNFLVYELVGTLFFVILYDFFFRGFLIQVFGVFFGNGVVLFQSVVFLVLVLFASSNPWTFAPYLLFTPFAGIIAKKSKSLLYSSFAQLIIIILLDAVVVKIIH